MKPSAQICPLLIWTAAIVFSGCGKDAIREYEVPKNELDSLLAGEAAAMRSASQHLAWNKPDEWSELVPTQMRKANYLVDSGDQGSVEITVSSFPGDTGGTRANINRWRGQAGLPPLSIEDIDSVAKPITLAGQSGYIVDIQPTAEASKALRIVAAAIPYQGNTWFFKMSGPQQLVAEQESTFGQFLNSVRIEIQDASSPIAAEMVEERTPVTFNAPDDWLASQGSSVRLASFTVPNSEGEDADFSLTRFPGSVGGLEQNVNRWRMQIGLAPWSENTIRERIETLDIKGRSYQFFDLKAETEEQIAATESRILVALLWHDQHTWFFKLMGTREHLETQKENLVKFLESVDFQSE